MDRDSGETCNDQLGHMEILLDSVEFDLNLPPELLYGIRHGQTLSAAPSKGSQYKSPTATYNRMDTRYVSARSTEKCLGGSSFTQMFRRENLNSDLLTPRRLNSTWISGPHHFQQISSKTHLTHLVSKH